MIDRQTVFEIRRLHNLGWKERKIARKLRLSRSAVKRHIENPEPARERKISRTFKLDPYRDRIKELLEEDPEVKATVVLQWIEKECFDGKTTIVRDYLRNLREQQALRIPFIRFESPPGKQMQIDWGHFGSLSPTVDTKAVEQIFRHKVLKMLLAKGKITRDMIAFLDNWRHSRFNAFFGPRILPRQEESMENLVRYIVRASFSRERMTYHRETGQVEYQSKDGKETRVFDALEWLAAMCSHVPNKGEQMVRYYGNYSNVARGKQKEADTDDKIPCILEPELTDKAFRKNWAQLIQKIYEVDPLVCPKCFSEMRLIAVIEDPDVIKKILKYLDLWEIKRKPRPVANAPPGDLFPAYDEQPGPCIDDYITDPDYLAEAYF